MFSQYLQHRVLLSQSSQYRLYDTSFDNLFKCNTPHYTTCTYVTLHVHITVYVCMSTVSVYSVSVYIVCV